MTEDELNRAEELLSDPDSEDNERFASRYGHSLIALARQALSAPSGWVVDSVSQSLPGYDGERAASAGAAPSAALRLARCTLEYVGWLDGTLDKSGLMDADAEMKDLALKVYAAIGEEPPARVNRVKGKRP